MDLANAPGLIGFILTHTWYLWIYIYWVAFGLATVLNWWFFGLSAAFLVDVLLVCYKLMKNRRVP